MAKTSFQFPLTTIINVVLLALNVTGGQSTYFNYMNKCSYTVWIGAAPVIDEAMWIHPPNTIYIFQTPDVWTGSIWLRTGCEGLNLLNFTCVTGDCGTNMSECTGGPPKYPVTLLNFALNQSVATYEVNLNHGFNVPVRIEPVEGATSCPMVECPTDINKSCPSELLYTGPDGSAVACQSPCDALKDPKYCCTGPDACQPNQYSQLFKKACPLSHTYPKDNVPPINQCTGATYNITLCP